MFLIQNRFVEEKCSYAYIKREVEQSQFKELEFDSTKKRHEANRYMMRDSPQYAVNMFYLVNKEVALAYGRTD